MADSPPKRERITLTHLERASSATPSTPVERPRIDSPATPMERPRIELDSGTHSRPRSVVQVRFQPIWDHIEALRTFVGAYCRTRLSAAAAERAILVAHELLENAVRYGDVTAEVEFDLRVDPAGRMFEIRVINDAVASRSEILKKELERIDRLEPETAFGTAVQRARSTRSASGMLGLSRVRFEGQVELTAHVDGRRVEVVARGRA